MSNVKRVLFLLVVCVSTLAGCSRSGTADRPEGGGPGLSSSDEETYRQLVKATNDTAAAVERGEPASKVLELQKTQSEIAVKLKQLPNEKQAQLYRKCGAELDKARDRENKARLAAPGR